MAANRGESNGSLHAPLLGTYAEGNRDSVENGSQHDVAFPNELRNESPNDFERVLSGKSAFGTYSLGGQDDQSESNLENPELAAQSRSTFQRIHDARGPASHNHSRQGVLDLPPSRSKRRRDPIRNPNKSFVARAAHNAKHDTWNFLYNLMIGLYMWPKWSWDAMKANSSLTVLSVKQGVCSGLACILCVVKFPKPWDQLSSIALWAVVTTDLLYEGNIGLSVSKGFNRVLGTLAAGFIGFGLNQIGPELGWMYPYYLIFCVSVGGAVFRFLKGIPPLKDQWGYAFTVATIAYHLFMITAYLDPERWTLPILRFAMILLGFAMSTAVNIAIQPIYAGDALHKLVAKNFETAATVFERCVEEYNKDTKLDHVPDILSERAVDDKIHQSYHEIVMSDSDIDKLLSAVHWEPSHGKFFMGYPWDMYDDITDYLRYTLYDVIALDMCLRANIQAPKDLRDIFAEEMATISKECANVLRMLGDSMKNMKRFSSEDIMKRAEEAAVALQYKIYLNTPLLLGRAELDSPNVRFGSPSPFANLDRKPESFPEQSNFPNEAYQEKITDEYSPSTTGIDNLNARDVSASINIPSTEKSRDSGVEQKEVSSKVGSPGRQPVFGSPSPSPSPQKAIFRARSGPLKKPPMETLTEGVPAISITIPQSGSPRSVSTVEPEQDGRSTPGRGTNKKSLQWQHTFLQRRTSLGPAWDGTLERISALSLVKFASLLIEVVSKMKYVVDCVEELSKKARFQE